jgi:hypothetical protein
MKLYIYSMETNQHIATIIGRDNSECEGALAENYGSDDYGATYSPAFGCVGGLVENIDAVEIVADKQ